MPSPEEPPTAPAPAPRPAAGPTGRRAGAPEPPRGTKRDGPPPPAAGARGGPPMGASEEGDEEGPEDPARLPRAACSQGSTTCTGAAGAKDGEATGPEPDARGEAAPASDREAWSLARSDASNSRSTAASPEPSRPRLRPETASLEDPRERSIATTDEKGRRRGGEGLDLTKRRIGKRRRRRSAAEAGNPRKGGTDPFRTHK